MEEPDGEFTPLEIIQFGEGYQGARDIYIYAYNQKRFTNGLVLLRIPKDEIENRSAYEFFAGFDGNGDPLWSKEIKDKSPVFADANGVGWGVNAVFHPVAGRYLLTVRHDDSGGWGIFDAPEQLGPWTTVAYYDSWIDSEL